MLLYYVFSTQEEMRTPQVLEVEHLMFYKKSADVSTQEDAEGDDLANFGEYWDLQDLQEVEF